MRIVTQQSEDWVFTGFEWEEDLGTSCTEPISNSRLEFYNNACNE